jgi:diacylglycerol kinase family enzyme
MESVQISPSELRVAAIINTSSGGCDSESEAEMLEIFKAAGVSNCKTWCGEAKQIERAFAEAATHKPEVLVVLGGDGTIRAAAEMCSKTDTYLVPLPGGTMNMLPRAVYGDASWHDTLESTLSHPATKPLSGGRVGEELFFVAAIVGAPGLWMEAREAVREGDVVELVEKSAVALHATFDTKLNYFISSEINGEAEVVAVICPLISAQMPDSEQALEAAAVDVESAAEVIRIATAAAFGKWRDDKSVSLSKTRRLTVESKRDIPLFLDGEKVKARKNAEITFVPCAVNVIVPSNLNHFSSLNATVANGGK